MEDSVKLEIQEKSVFERAIIEAFKQFKVSEIYEKLNIAYSELPLYISEIKKLNTQEKNKHYIINSNIIDKIGRLIERNYVNINILISKIFDTFLEQENLNILSDNSYILITLSNQMITILELIKSCHNYQELTEKAINYMIYLTDNSDKFLSQEQMEIIIKLQNQLTTKIKSLTFVKFQNNYLKDLLILCKGETAEEKEKGIEYLNSYFSKLNSINEQFDLLCLFGEDIIKAIISKPNPILIDTYYKLCYFFISFLYNFIYKLKLNHLENEDNSNLDFIDINKLNEQYYILDSMEENIEIPDNLYVTKFQGKEYHNIKISNQLYELDSIKKILLKHTSIFSLAISLLNCLILFQESFKAQFACFLILKRLYFIFPKYLNEISDLIVTNLINLISFNDNIIENYKDIFKPFLIYLIQKGEENTKNKLIERLNKKKNELKKDYLNIDENNNNIDIEKNNVESDTIYLSNFNLNIGCPLNIEIAAGDEEEKIIEVKYPNSLLYIGFSLNYYNINFHLIKYCPNLNFALMSKDVSEKKEEYEDQKFFYEIFKLEKSKGAKIVLFIKNPGIYKIIFDNKYSWINTKELKYRCTILKEFNNNLELSGSNSNDEIKLDKKESIDDINNIENNKEIEKENIEESEEIKINVNINNKINEQSQDINLDREEPNKLDSENK